MACNSLPAANCGAFAYSLRICAMSMFFISLFFDLDNIVKMRVNIEYTIASMKIIALKINKLQNITKKIEN